MRTFKTGATRDSDDTKPDYEGFLSPEAIIRFGQYMTKHRIQADGSVRDSDNWRKGIPTTAYAKSLWRHLVEFWTLHRHRLESENVPSGFEDEQFEDALCAIIFNAQGYLHEHIKSKRKREGMIPCRPAYSSIAIPKA